MRKLLKDCRWCGKTVIKGYGERHYCDADHAQKSIEYSMDEFERDYKEEYDDWMKDVCTG